MMQRHGLLERHNDYDLDQKKKELEAVITAMNETDILKETIKLLFQRMPLELHQMTRQFVARALDKYRLNDAPLNSARPFYIPSQLRQAEVVEFEGFAPYLREFSEQLFVHQAVVYLGFRLIFAEYLPNDDSLWAKAQTALAKEANDLILAFTSASKEGISSSEGFGVGLGDVFKPSLPKLPSFYSFKITAPKEYVPPLVRALELPLNERERDAVLKSISLATVDQYSSSWMRNSLDVGVSPSIQYLPLLIFPYCHLMDWVGISSSKFIDSQIITNYLPLLESHSMQSIASTFSSSKVTRFSNILEKRGVHAVMGSSSVYVLECVTDFCMVVDNVGAATYHLQIVQAEMEELLTSLCRLFLDKCEHRIRGLLTGNMSDGIQMTSISGQLVRTSKELVSLLSEHRRIESPEHASLVGRKETTLLESLKTERSLTRGELIKDAQSIVQLCLLYQSLAMIPGMLKSKKGAMTSLYEDDQILYCAYLGVEPNELFSYSSSFNKQFNGVFLKTISELSRDCLFIVREELKVMCMYYLDLAYREGHYHVESAEYFSQGPDPYIIQLTNAIATFKQSVKAISLKPSDYDFIFTGLAGCIEYLMVQNVRHIRGPVSVRDLGLKILRANIDAMEQSIAVLLDDNQTEYRLDRVREYYDLLEMTPEQLMESVEQSGKPRFTYSEYQSVLKVHYSAKGGTNTDKELSSQLVRLKYLLESAKGN